MFKNSINNHVYIIFIMIIHLNVINTIYKNDNYGNHEFSHFFYNSQIKKPKMDIFLLSKIKYYKRELNKKT